MEVRESQTRWSELVKDLASLTSKTNLAKRIGVTQREITRWVDGSTTPHGSNAEALIRECGEFSINWRKYQGLTSIYDFRVTFERNVHEGPQGLPAKVEGWIPQISTRIFDYELNSPLGVPASVLTINSYWIEALSRLGFDAITSKTVRTKKVPSHPLPNCVYLPDLREPTAVGTLPRTVRGTSDTPNDSILNISLANSFGMPSPEPPEWQADLERTLKILQQGQILIVSIVGTADDPTALVNDFVRCAELAYEVKPHVIEPNFSCPNVYGQEGSVFQNPEMAATICKRMRKALPNAKIVIKIGYLKLDELNKLFNATYKYVDGYTAINTLSAQIVSDGQQKEQVFPGAGRVSGGVSGIAIREYSIEVVKNLRILANKKPELEIFGVGGVSSASDVKAFKEAGAGAVQICTAALLNPLIAAEIRRQMARESDSKSRSRVLGKTGLSVPFTDNGTAKVFDGTLKVCEKMGVPFEQAFAIVQDNWLTGYLNDLREVNASASSPQKTRRDPPTEAQIETWIRDELKKKR